MENVNNNRVELQILDSAFEKRIHTFAIINNEHIDIGEFLKDAFHLYKIELISVLREHSMVKTKAVLIAEFEKSVPNPTIGESNHNIDEEVLIKQTLYFWTNEITIGSIADFDKLYEENIVDEIQKNVEDVAIEGSGFTLAQIIKLDAIVCSYEPLKGSSYIETPKKLQKKMAIVNVRNVKDNFCFMWSILSALHPIKRNPNRLYHYKKYQNELNFNGINFPVPLHQIDKFEHQNDTISINVYYYDDADKCVRPLRVSTDTKEHHIHLLMIIDEVNVDNITDRDAPSTAAKIITMLHNKHIRMHYCWIKDLGRLVSKQQSKHGHKIFICDRCLNFFNNKEMLKKHLKYCTNDCRIEMPEESEKWLQFKNHKNHLKAPFVIYADTEAFLKRLDAEERKRVFNEKCSTTAYQEHHVYSIGYYYKCEYDDSMSYYTSSGDSSDCIDWFIKELHILAKVAAVLLSRNQPMKKLTDDEEKLLEDPEAKCSICGGDFEADELRTRDHHHYTG